MIVRTARAWDWGGVAGYPCGLGRRRAASTDDLNGLACDRNSKGEG